MNKTGHTIQRLCTIILGLVFYTSGVLKLMDPVGAGLIAGEYMKFLHLGFLRGISLPAGIAVSLVEAGTGIALMTGVYKRIAACATAAMLAVFTILTALLWIFNPSMDCGCFGEAVHLSHAQSFLKNIILIGLACAAFIPMDTPGKTPVRKLAAFWILAVSVAGVSIYSTAVRPMTDFTQFNLSSKLLASEESAPVREYVSVFIYEKNGEQGAFTLDSLPDSTWTYVRTETTEKQNVISMTDFPELAIRDAEGNYCDSLATGDRVMVLSAYHPEKISKAKWSSIAAFLDNADEDFTAILLLAATPQQLDALIPDGLPEEMSEAIRNHAYYSDYKTLVALNRSNGGATYFQNGNLIDRWTVRTLPEEDRLSRIARKDATDLMIRSSTDSRLAFQAFFLYSIVILLFL